MSRRFPIFMITASLVVALVAGAGLIVAKKYLTGAQLVLLLLSLYAAVRLFEFVHVARNQKVDITDAEEGYLSLVGKRAIVLNECAPEGTVEVGHEVWNAIAVNGSTLKVGQEVIVSGRQGLKLSVDAALAEPARHHTLVPR